jgi:hypothetical protein
VVGAFSVNQRRSVSRGPVGVTTLAWEGAGVFSALAREHMRQASDLYWDASGPLPHRWLFWLRSNGLAEQRKRGWRARVIRVLAVWEH